MDTDIGYRLLIPGFAFTAWFFIRYVVIADTPYKFNWYFLTPAFFTTAATVGTLAWLMQSPAGSFSYFTGWAVVFTLGAECFWSFRYIKVHLTGADSFSDDYKSTRDRLLRALAEGVEERKISDDLKKEVAILKAKIHHLETGEPYVRPKFLDERVVHRVLIFDTILDLEAHEKDVDKDDILVYRGLSGWNYYQRMANNANIVLTREHLVELRNENNLVITDMRADKNAEQVL